MDKLNSRWCSSLMIGVLSSPLTRSSLPVTAFGFKKDVWLLAGDSVYHNGNKVCIRRLRGTFTVCIQVLLLIINYFNLKR